MKCILLKLFNTKILKGLKVLFITFFNDSKKTLSRRMSIVSSVSFKKSLPYVNLRTASSASPFAMVIKILTAIGQWDNIEASPTELDVCSSSDNIVISCTCSKHC